MASYLDELNDIQRLAVTTSEGPVLVVAGPGSGKTRVLTYRIAHLIESGVAPWQILALTFTNKAAREMKERITKVVGDRANSVWAGTFHSIFARILRVEAEKIGYPKDFTIYDSDDSKSLLRSIVKEMGLDKESYTEGALLTRISSAKSNLISPKGYAANEELMLQDRTTKRPYIYKVYQEYANRCKRSGAMDFDDLLYQLYVLLHNNPESVREKYQAKFKYLLVDEFQDTNFLQYAIVKKLIEFPGSPNNICVVGDDAQSIYAFRGATIENILDFQKDFKNLQTFKLEQNYRSTTHIVEAANEVIKYNKRQIQKNIWSDKGEGQKIKLIKTMTDQEEAKRVADLVMEQKNRYHLQNREIAILYRTNSQSRPFEEWLRRLNLPYRVYGGMSFYQRKEVKDVIAYLRLIVNPKDEEALRRIINYPRRGIGDSTLEKLSALAASKNQSLWATLPEYEGTAREKTAIHNFTLLMQTFMSKAKSANAKEVAQYVVKQARVLEVLKEDTSLEGLGRIENVEALLNAISEFVDSDELIPEDGLQQDKSLATYLQNIALVTDADNADPNADVVTLMSVHSAKGLEYKSVIVAGLEENLFPSFMSMDTPEGLDEERRLFYVAITRAEQFLALTYSSSRYRYGQMKYSEPSRFLEEIVTQHLDGATVAMAKKEVEKARITGNFTRPNAKQGPVISINPADFKPSPSENMEIGMKVLHMKFGEGKIIGLDGAKDNKVATIHFKDITDQPERKIMLKFAKLQIL